MRLPGFRPGKIPLPVLRQHYGQKSRAEVVRRLAAEFAGCGIPEGGMLAAVEVAAGAETGDLQFRVTATYLPDLPAVDFSNLDIERLIPEHPNGQNDPNPQSDAAAHSYLKKQVLDHLARIYEFPVAPILIEREFAAILKAAEAQLDLGPANRAEIEAELRGIAERRIRLGMVIAETARRNDVRVSDADVETAPHDAAEPVDQRRRRMLEEKVIAWILARARITERTASNEELANL